MIGSIIEATHEGTTKVLYVMAIVTVASPMAIPVNDPGMIGRQQVAIVPVSALLCCDGILGGPGAVHSTELDEIRVVQRWVVFLNKRCFIEPAGDYKILHYGH